MALRFTAAAALLLTLAGCQDPSTASGPPRLGTGGQELNARAPLTPHEVVVLGQADAGYWVPNRVDARGMDQPTGVAIDSSVTPPRLYVTDYWNSRVLAWKNADGFTRGQPADLILGKPSELYHDPDYDESDPYGDTDCDLPTGDKSLCHPWGITVDAAGTVFVADSWNNRVLAYRTPFGRPDTTPPFVPDAIADVVYGQASMTGRSPNRGSNDLQRGLRGPTSVAISTDGDLFVADTANNRVIVYRATVGSDVPDTTADVALGQPNLTTATLAAASATALNHPQGVAVDPRPPHRVVVGDTDYNRVLIWDDASALVSGAAATGVLGQGGDLTLSGCNDSGVTAGSLCTPTQTAVDALGRIYVADQDNERVLAFDEPLTGTAARVYGQPNMQSRGCGFTSATSLCEIWGLALSPSGKLFVPDHERGRLLRYDDPWYPDQTQARTANEVLGQGDFSASKPNGVSADGMEDPEGIVLDLSVDPPHVYVVDNDNSRVLGWKDVSALQSGAPADLVIGQPEFSGSSCNAGGRTERSLCHPNGAAVDREGRLYVADTDNDRILIYSAPFNQPAQPTTPPTWKNQPAGRVVGQSSYAGGSCNRGQANAGASTLCAPEAVAVGANFDLLVADTANSRVLAYLNWIAKDPALEVTADRVLGQADFIAHACNAAGNLDTRLCQPAGVALQETAAGGSDPSRLYVSDTRNNRVLAFDWPFANHAAAAKWYGQTTLAAPGNGSDTCGSIAPAQGNLCEPSALALDGAGDLYITDKWYNRVLFVDDPLTNVLPSRLYGQALYSSLDCDAGKDDLCDPSGVAIDANGALYVTDSTNNRAVIYLGDHPPAASALTLTPAQPRSADPLVPGYQFTDVDGDPQAGSELRWYRNGAEETAYRQTLSAATPTPLPLPASATLPGDAWSFTVRPRDGAMFGAIQTSPTVTIGQGPPTAAASAEARVPLGEEVDVTSLGSHAEDPTDPLNYAWSWAAFPTEHEPAIRPTVETEGGQPVSHGRFTPTVAGNYTVRLQVRSGALTSPPVFVTVIAGDVGGAAACGASTVPGGASTAPLWLGAAWLLGRWRSRRRRP